MPTVKGYLRLLRVPLFVTAAADVLAGYTVASLGAGQALDPATMAALAVLSSALYLFGMAENDFVDRERDRLASEPRPLVTGQATSGMALLLMGVLVVGAVVASARLPGAAWLLAIATFGVINLYNLAAKKGPFHIAMIVMGLCRLLNVGIGITAAIGVPVGIDTRLAGLGGPLWFRHAMAVFFASFVATGYSILARRGERVSSRPWQLVFVVAVAAGLGMLIYGQAATGRFHPPVARAFAALLLTVLWPGELWSVVDHHRGPRAYGPFVERMLYWMIAMDAAFVMDAMLVHPWPAS